MPSAASSTRSPRTSTPATTPMCWPSRPSSPSTWSATWCWMRRSPRPDVDTERVGDPGRDRHAGRRPGGHPGRRVRGGRLRRAPGRRPGDRHGGDHRSDVPRPRSPATTAAGTARTRWSSRSPAASTTATSSRWVRAAFRDRLDSDAVPQPALPGHRRGRPEPAAPAGRRAGHRAGASVHGRARRRPQRPATLRPGRAVRRARRRDEFAAVPHHPRGDTGWPTPATRPPRPTPTSARSRCTPVASPDNLADGSKLIGEELARRRRARG